MNTAAMSSSQNNEGLKCQDMLVEERWVEWGYRCSCKDYVIVSFLSPGLEEPRIHVCSDRGKESYPRFVVGLRCHPEFE